jgi:lysophospholipase L1-like esterase
MATVQGRTVRAMTARPPGGSLLLYVGLSALLVLTLIGLDVLVLVLNVPALSRHHYYVALGDSITFGFQPNDDITDGYADDLFSDLRAADVTDSLNFACGGESSTTMIQGGCQFKFATHVKYSGSQLNAAINFLHAHPGQVSPVTLDIGANDMLPDYDAAHCTAKSTMDADLATLDTNLTKTILPRLLRELTTPRGQRTGDLILLDYYNPFAKQCPDSASFIHVLNDHLVSDAAQFRVPVVDVYTAFGGDAQMADNVCTLTWFCDATFHDFHPTSRGYRVIADTLEQLLGYPTGGIPNPVQNIPVPAGPPATADSPRRLGG